MSATDDLLADFPVVVDVPVAWGDMDANQHVNNVVYLRWFETARIACFDAIGWTRSMSEGGVGPILARTTCVFRIPLTFPDTVRVGARIEDVGDDRFTMVYRVVSTRHGAVAADGDGRIVAFDYATGTKARLPDAIRDAIRALAGA
jgi:acyl-CoA thioester hydrolase